MLYKYMIMEGKISVNPMSSVNTLKLQKHLPEVLHYKAVEEILQARIAMINSVCVIRRY